MIQEGDSCDFHLNLPIAPLGPITTATRETSETVKLGRKPCQKGCGRREKLATRYDARMGQTESAVHSLTFWPEKVCPPSWTCSLTNTQPLGADPDESTRMNYWCSMINRDAERLTYIVWPVLRSSRSVSSVPLSYLPPIWLPSNSSGPRLWSNASGLRQCRSPASRSMDRNW